MLLVRNELFGKTHHPAQNQHLIVSSACPDFSVRLDYLLALSMAPSNSRLRNRGLCSLVSSSPAIMSAPPVFWINGSLQLLPSGLSPRLDFPEAEALKSRSLMLVMSQNTWFPNQDKNCNHTFFFLLCEGSWFFDLSNVDLISKGLLHTHVFIHRCHCPLFQS